MFFCKYIFKSISNSIVFNVWIVMFLEFTKTNISNNPSTLISFVACLPHMMTLKPPSPSPICSSKTLKFRNYVTMGRHHTYFHLTTSPPR